MKKNTHTNIDQIRNDFPILKRKVNGQNLIYFDNAATSQTPQIVIDSIADYYSKYNSNNRRFYPRRNSKTDKKLSDKKIRCSHV